MAEYDPHFKDRSGPMTLFLGLAVVICMAGLPATIAWVRYFAG